MSTLTDLRDSHYKGVTTNDLDLAASAFTDDVVTVTPQGTMQGMAAFRAFGQAFVDAAPDATLVAERTFEVGNAIITEGTFSGTQTGDLAGPGGQTIPASGRRFSFPFVDIMELGPGDKFASHRIYWDLMGMLAQLGAIPG